MCGIAGILDRTRAGSPERIVAAMVADLERRGPDGQGAMRRGPVAFGHRRLSILDPEGGRQPMINEDGDVWVTYNGEIYNFRELVSQLEARGHRFRTRCDTEVLVHAWEEWGESCLARLRGMFAFAIMDWRRGAMFLARDHFGIKPLHYISTPEAFAFASEIAPLRRVPGFRPDLDLRAIDEYLWFQYVSAPRSALAQVRKLPPAHSLIVELDGTVHEPREYWRLAFVPEEGRSSEEWIERVDAAVEESVRAHLVSDVPFGAFLSGGVDSSLVVAKMAKVLGHPVETFSIGNIDPDYDESAWAKMAAQATGSRSHLEMVDADALTLLPDLVRHYGEPFADSSAIPTWHVSRLARRHVPMVLSGDGADEFFAGYWSHGDWMAGAGSRPGPHRLEDWISHIHYMPVPLRAALWRPELAAQACPTLPDVFGREWARTEGLHPLHRVQHMDARTYLHSAILTKVDIASMMHGLEVRTPLVDLRVAEVACAIPAAHSMVRGADGAWNRKQVLKAVAARLFPRGMFERPKMGFAIPVAKWFRPGTVVWKAVAERFLEAGSPLRGYFREEGLRHVLEACNGANIWQLLFLDEWLRQLRSEPSEVDAGPGGTSPRLESAPKATEPAAHGIAEAIAAHGTPMGIAPKTPRPRILVMADVRGWIFERHALTLKEKLADEFDIEVVYQGQQIDEARYDLVYPLEWNLVPAERIGNPAKWVTGIRSHITWHDLDRGEFAARLARYGAVHVVSRRLEGLLRGIHPNLQVLTHGIDLEHFRTVASPSEAAGRLRVGWAGNRKSPAKGFEEFIEPLGRIPGVDLVFCGYSDRLLSFPEMRDFYEGIDVYVCSSSTEGNNNSLLEAAAMGRAIVTTDVGTVPEYLQDGVSALIVPRRAEAFREAIVRLLEDPGERCRLGREAARSVDAFSWERKLLEHRAFFRAALGRAPRGLGADAGGDVSDLLEHAETLLGSGKPAEALVLLEQAASRCKGDARVVGIRDDLRRKLKRVPSVAASSPCPPSKAAGAGRADVGALADEALRLAMVGNLGQARAVVAAIRDSAPGNPELNQVLERVDRFLAARMQPASDDVRGLLDAADAAFQAGRAEDALAALDRCEELAPSSLEVINAKAWVLVQMERMPAAHAQYIKATRVAPDDPSAHANLAGIRLRMGQSERAEASLRRVLELSPGDAEAWLALSRIVQSREGLPGSGTCGRPWGISFCIITNGKRPEKLRREIDSIRALAIPDYEILVGGEPPEGFDDVRHVPAVDAARNGRLGEMRNRLTEAARFDLLVVADDDMIFHPDFYKGILAYGDDFDVLAVRLLNPDGTRFWDWAMYRGPGIESHHLLEYTETSPDVYVTGGLCVMKAHVAQLVKWDEGRGFYQGEDLDFSARLHHAGVRISLCTAATVTHDDPRYTQVGRVVARRDDASPAEGDAGRTGRVMPLPAVRWAAPMLNFTGYARLSRDAVEALDDQGVTVSVQPLDSHQDFVRNIEASPDKVARWSRLLAQNVPEGLFVCSYIATDWSGKHDILGAHRKANPGYRRYAALTMFETDRLPAGWKDACNGMDEIWVPSRFNAESFAAAGVDRKKIQVIPLGIRTRDFDPAGRNPHVFQGRGGFNFLSVFEWTDRKGWDVLLRAYFEAFDAEDDVCLAMRTSLPNGSSGTVTERIVEFARANGYDLDRIPAISVIEQPLTDEEMPSLYAACDAFVLPTRGEGWGIPFLEAMCMGLPVLATRWSAHLDFLDDSNGYLIDVDAVVPVPRDKAPSPLYGPDHRWAEPSVRHAAKLMRHVFENRDEARARGAKARADVLEKWDSKRTARWIQDRLQGTGPEVSSESAQSTMGATKARANGQHREPGTTGGSDSRNGVPMVEANEGQGGAFPLGNREDPARGRAAKPVQQIDLRTPIVWRGGFFDFSGYSKLSREILLSLDKAGARAHIEAFNAQPRFLETLQKSPDALVRFEKLLAPRPGGGIGVAAFPPTHGETIDVYTYFRGSHRDVDLCVGLTMFETDGLPPGWADRCNTMDEIWLPSRFNAETFANAGVVPDKLRVIPCGIDLTHFDPARVRPLPIVGRKGFTFLSVFQWTYRKGWDLLLRAWAQAFTREDDVCLVIRAYPFEDKGGPIGDRIKAYLASIGVDPEAIAPIVLLDGFVDECDMPALYAASDCFVLPTRGEGWGIPYLEAMAMGKPAIATRWSAHLEFMNDGNSLLVDVEAMEAVQAEMRQDNSLYTADQKWARASVTDLVAKMRAVFANRDLAMRLGAAARRDVLREGGVERTAEWILERAKSLEQAPGTKTWIDGADLPRIAVDARTLYVRDSTDRGIGNYTYHHLRAILEARPGWRFTLIAPADALPPPPEIERLLRYPNVRLSSLDRYRQDDFDLVHICDPLSMALEFVPPASALPHPRRTSVFYDLIPLRVYLDKFTPAARAVYLERLRLNLESNIVLLAISEHTRTDLKCEARISDWRIRTIGGGLNLSAAEGSSSEDSQACLDRLGIQGQFFIHVGSLDPHKNFEATLQAFLAARARIPVQLVVVGRLQYSIQHWAELLRERRIEGVVFTDYLERADLETLYSRAAGLVTMSLYEGFGFPVLEAMAQGCPVLASNRTSLPEVAGDAALLVDPEDGKAIVDAMRALLERPDLRDELRRRGRERAKLFSWSQVAARTLSNWEDMLATIPPHAGPRSGRSSGATAHPPKDALGAGQAAGAGNSRTPASAPANDPVHTGGASLDTLPALAPVLWHSPIFDPSGYADEARQFLLHLERARAPVAARSIGRDSPTFRAQCDPAERSALERLIEAEPGLEPISVVWFPAYAFQRLEGARYHVGRTTFETDGLPQAWIEACHRMDEIWVPSRFNVDSFRRAGVRTRIEVVPEGVESARFRPGLEPLPLPAKRGCTFLSIFEWTHRKGWDVLLRAWARAFGPGDDVQIVLRAYPPNVVEGDPAAWIEERIDQFLAGLGTSRTAIAPIVVLGRQVPAPEMPRLYAAADCYVAASRGEGWGRPHMEAMSSGLPVIATRWGGNLDFMDDGNSYLLAIDGLEEIDVREEFEFYRGQKWASPSVDDLVRHLRHVRDHRDEAAETGRRARRDIEERWDWASIAPIAERRLREISGEIGMGGARPTPTAASPSRQGVPKTATSSTESPQGVATTAAPAMASGMLSVRWEGSQFVHHSLAHVNRELCLGLAKAGHDMSIIAYEPDQFGPGEDPDLGILAQLTGAPLDAACQVHVRHQWPPILTPPSEGRWVVIQPWEFGSPPRDWMPAFRDQVDEIWAYTTHVRDLYLRAGVPADRVHVVPLGVDTEKFRPSLEPLPDLPARRGVRFLYVGGTIGRKGFDLLLRAWEKAFGSADPVELVIKDMGGKTSYQGQTSQDAVRRLQESGRCAPIVYRDDDLAPSDLPRLYAAGDVLVHPYRGEGFGLPIAEAMACGLPVIVTDGGAADDFCGPESGWKIPARVVPVPGGRVGSFETVEPPTWLDPDLDALVAALREAAARPDLRQVRGRAARARIETGFTWTHAVERAEERLRVVAAKPARCDEAPGGAPRHQPRVDTFLDAHRGNADEKLASLLVQVEASAGRGELGAAEALTHEAVAMAPHSPLAWVAHSMILRATGKFAQAVVAIRKGLEREESPTVLLEAVEAYHAAGDRGNALRLAGRLKERHADWVHAQRASYKAAGKPWTPDLVKSGKSNPKGTGKGATKPKRR